MVRDADDQRASASNPTLADVAGVIIVTSLMMRGMEKLEEITNGAFSFDIYE